MFEQGKLYNRRAIHAQYGGQQQGGISTPANHSFILLFAGKTGELYGYEDRVSSEDEVEYSGEGQIGNMSFVRGNKAVRDHAGNGKELHLFESEGKGLARYVGQYIYIGHEIRERSIGGDRRARAAIVFRLKRVGS